jgi:hypothetical protein
MNGGGLGRRSCVPHPHPCPVSSPPLAAGGGRPAVAGRARRGAESRRTPTHATQPPPGLTPTPSRPPCMQLEVDGQLLRGEHDVKLGPCAHSWRIADSAAVGVPPGAAMLGWRSHPGVGGMGDVLVLVLQSIGGPGASEGVVAALPGLAAPPNGPASPPTLRTHPAAAAAVAAALRAARSLLPQPQAPHKRARVGGPPLRGRLLQPQPPPVQTPSPARGRRSPTPRGGQAASRPAARGRTTTRPREAGASAPGRAWPAAGRQKAASQRG